MKLYAICWQDSMEPWGWAPIEPDDEAAKGVLGFYWNETDALNDLEKIVAQSTELYLRDAYRKPTPERAREWAEREHSVREYEVPEPPQRVRLTW